MYSISSLQSGLTGLIGCRDTKTTDIPAIDSSQTASSSGQYWDDFHPLLNTENLFYCAPNFEAESYATWSGLITYSSGQRVIYSGVAWQSKADVNLNNTPAAGTWWKTVFSTWVGEKINTSIASLFNRLATEKKLNLSTKSIFDNLQLFTGPGRLQDTITNSGRMVGLRIHPKMINNIRIILDKIGVQFSDAQTGFNIYLYHSSRQAAVASMAITTTVAYRFEWKTLTAGSFDLDFVNFADNIDSGGYWYMAYFEDDITGSSINKKYDFEYGPCNSCANTQDEYRIYNLWNRYVDIEPFYVSADDLDGANLPDIDNMAFTPTTNYGLNLSMTVKPDVTELVLFQKNQIIYPLGMQFAYDMISWMIFNPPVRVNPNAVNTKMTTQQLYYERDGDANSDGFKHKLSRAISALAEDLSKLSTALPDNKPSRVSYGAI